MTGALRTAESLVPPTRRRAGLRVLRTDGDVVYAGRGLDLMRSRDGGVRFERVAGAGTGALQRAVARAPIASRVLRAGFHGVTPLAGGGLVAIVRGAVLHLNSGARRFDVAHRVTRGTRPLNVGLAPSGRLYFGEYFGNPERGEVHVYGSDDGRSFDVAYTFPAGRIRHVHGVWPDPYRGGVWVLTGDDDDESGLFFTDDDFRTLEPVVAGSQRARAVAVIPCEDGVVVPTDTPREQNHVQWLDVESARLEAVAPVPGSVFSAARTEGHFVVSTTLEPSEVNVDPRVALLVSENGFDWRTIARYPRDLAFLNDRRGVLTYPTLELPAGRGGARVLASGRALKGQHGALLAWDERALLGTA
ncbi:MAG: hypothetical protein AAFP86_08900 [Planctomycetota bacterium]